MPLHHTQAHEEKPAPLTPSPVQETPHQAGSTPVSASVSSDAPRYDAATVKQIIALAEQMQAHHRQTLSADEVEALGHEVGVEPQFIRRALLQVEAQQATQVTKNETVSRRARRVSGSPRARRVPLSRRQWMLMTVPPSLYLLFAVLTLSAVAMADPFAVMLYLLVPAALALCVGIQGGSTGSRRVGVVGGGLFGLAMFLSIILNAAFHEGGPVTFGGEFFLVLGVMLGSGALFGIVGDTIHRITSKEGGKRLRINPLVKWKG